MCENNLYSELAARTDGAVMLGVVGPVRTGKSSFIKRFMETLVIPHIENTFLRERAKDELPQSASGKTIMTGPGKRGYDQTRRQRGDLCPPGGLCGLHGGGGCRTVGGRAGAHGYDTVV